MDERLPQEHRDCCTTDKHECKYQCDSQCQSERSASRVQSEPGKRVLTPGTAESATNNDGDKQRRQQGDHGTHNDQVHQNWRT